MWRCERPTHVVLAALAGLVAAAVALPPLALFAGALGRGRVTLLVVALAALAVGDARADALRRRVLTPGDFAGTVVVTGRPGDGRAVAHVRAAAENVLLDAPAARQGEIARVAGSLHPVFTPVAGFYATRGVHLELEAERYRVEGRRGGVWGAVDALHRAALRRLRVDRSPSPERALVAGIAIGEAAALPDPVRDEFRDSGLAHLVAVSGQNVALVIALTLVALGVVGVLGTPARVGALAATLVYVLVTGAGPSIVRAGVAGMLVSVAWLVSRPPARWHLLACGAVVVLAANPLELFDPGFQLSFVAVAAILGVVPRIERALGQALAVPVACTLATAPVVWWHFGRVAEWSVVANVLALPAAAPILWLGLSATLLGAVWPPLAEPPLALADALAGYLLWVATVCA